MSSILAEGATSSRTTFSSRRFFVKLIKIIAHIISSLLLFRKKARSGFLFGCKRPHDENLSLPPFFGFVPVLHGYLFFNTNTVESLDTQCRCSFCYDGIFLPHFVLQLFYIVMSQNGVPKPFFRFRHSFLQAKVIGCSF